jgi:conjugal transfer ATP-binding protein TraC
LEVVEISHEARDVYLIPQNFVDTGTILGGTVKLRNAVEAAMLAVGSAVPLFYLPLAFNIRLMIVIAVSVPLGVFGVVGIGGDSLTQFVAHWSRFMKRRRIVTPTPQGNLEANRHRHLRFISNPDRPRPIAEQMKNAAKLAEADRGSEAPAPQRRQPDRGDR